jgi:hypothetical protein
MTFTSISALAQNYILHWFIFIYVVRHKYYLRINVSAFIKVLNKNHFSFTFNISAC